MGVADRCKLITAAILGATAANHHKEMALKVMAPRSNKQRLPPIVEFMGKKPIAVEAIADNMIIDKLVREGFIDQLYNKR